MQLSEKQKIFPEFFFHLWNLHQFFNLFKERTIAIANLFPKLQTVKILVRPLSKKHRFRTRFGSQHVKASQIVPKSPWDRFNHVFSSFSAKLIWKVSPLMLGEILGVFVNTLTDDDKYRVQDCENLLLPIQMQLSRKTKNIFSILHQRFNILKEKMIIIANVFPKLQTVKKLFRTLSKKCPFRACLDSQHVKASQIPAKSPWEHFYQAFSSFWGKLIWKISPLVLG